MLMKIMAEDVDGAPDGVGDVGDVVLVVDEGGGG